MSEDEHETNFFGTALPELPNDTIPTRKPITVADQIAVDANGKRRFHGAFTGGFSAGYWNTVGSQEGWKPKEFKSSRAEKASRFVQNPNDFMDDEDTGEFGIAPQRIQTTDDFRAGGSEDKAPVANPVLNMFLTAAREKTCVSLLKRMGWRENKDGRVRKTKRTASKATAPSDSIGNSVKVYQCMLPPGMQRPAQDPSDEPSGILAVDVDSDGSGSDVSVTFNPDDFEELTYAPKTNRFGLGYRGLLSDRPAGEERGDRTADARHVNLFAPFEMVDRKKQQKLSIRGQAFGVGAFEEDDEDIYALDDMSRYTFEGAKGRKALAIEAPPVKYGKCIEGFKPFDAAGAPKKRSFDVDVPRDFRPRNWLQRRSRFDAAPEERKAAGQEPTVGLGRHMLTPDQRGEMLGHRKPAVPEAQVKPDEPKTPAAASGLKSEQAKQMLASFESRFAVSASAAIDETPAIVGLHSKSISDKLNEIYNKTFVSSAAVSADDDQSAAVKSGADAQPAEQCPKAAECEIIMKRETCEWLPCPLLYQLMNVEDPTRAAASAGSKVSAVPFSLLKHVNPEFTRSRVTSEKHFTSAGANVANEVIAAATANAYVPRAEPVVGRNPFGPPPTAAAAEQNAGNSAAPAPAVVPKADTRPKTELEQSILNKLNVHPSEKTDIFKAIFESSDEEDEDSDATEANVTETDKQPPARLYETKNILRNTSPPRGIFKCLPTIRQPLAAVEKPKEPALLPDAYGPSLPAVIVKPAPSALDAMDRKRSHTADSDDSSSSSSSDSEQDEWIVADKQSSASAKQRKQKKPSKKHRKSSSGNKAKKSKSKKSKKHKIHKK